jgi:hypothetical protein
MMMNNLTCPLNGSAGLLNAARRQKTCFPGRQTLREGKKHVFPDDKRSRKEKNKFFRTTNAPGKKKTCFFG